MEGAPEAANGKKWTAKVSRDWENRPHDSVHRGWISCLVFWALSGKEKGFSCCIILLLSIWPSPVRRVGSSPLIPTMITFFFSYQLLQHFVTHVVLQLVDLWAFVWLFHNGGICITKRPPGLTHCFWASAVIQSHHSTEPWVVNLQCVQLPPLQFHI